MLKDQIYEKGLIGFLVTNPIQMKYVLTEYKGTPPAGASIDFESVLQAFTSYPRPFYVIVDTECGKVLSTMTSVFLTNVGRVLKQVYKFSDNYKGTNLYVDSKESLKKLVDVIYPPWINNENNVIYNRLCELEAGLEVNISSGWNPKTSTLTKAVGIFSTLRTGYPIGSRCKVIDIPIRDVLKCLDCNVSRIPGGEFIQYPNSCTISFPIKNEEAKRMLSYLSCNIKTVTVTDFKKSVKTINKDTKPYKVIKKDVPYKRLTIFWDDGTSTKVETPESRYDAYSGFAIAVAKKAMGNGNKMSNLADYWMVKVPERRARAAALAAEVKRIQDKKESERKVRFEHRKQKKITMDRVRAYEAYVKDLEFRKSVESEYGVPAGFEVPTTSED